MSNVFNTFVIIYSEDPCYLEASLLKSTIEANDSQAAVDWFRENYNTDTKKYTIHEVYKLDKSWI